MGSLGTGGCGGSACSQIGCGNSFSITFEEGSTWGTGKHEVTIDTNDEALRSQHCSIYPYFSGRNVVCEGIYMTNNAIGVDGAPKRITLQITDEDGWVFKKTLEPKYDESYPNGKGCDKSPCLNASASVLLDGPGEPAVKTSIDNDRLPYSGPGGVGGAGGSGQATGHIGAACDQTSDCSPPQSCTNDFMGGELVCSMSCTTDAGCPGDSKCMKDIVSEEHELVSGYCLKPCTDQRACHAIGSTCREQPIGKFCF